MRILMLNHNLIGRGSFLRCRPLAEHLAQMGHTVEIITTSDAPSLQARVIDQEGVRIRISPRWGKLGNHDGGYAPVDIAWRLPRVFGAWDVVHAFEHRPNVAVPALAGKIRGLPIVSDWSDWWTRGGITTPRRPWEFIDRWEASLLEEGTKKISDAVTVVSTALEERARSIRIADDRLHLIPSGCDIERIQPLDRGECRSRLGFDEDDPVLTFSGFAFWDFEFLVEAFSRVLEDFPAAILAIVGHDKDSRIMEIARTRLEKRVRQVRFLGRFELDQLALPLGASDIQLLPMEDTLANRARWPIKFGDYLASGRPTVTCRVGDFPSILEEEQAGIVTDPHPEAFANGILQLIEDRNLRERTGHNARRVAEDKLSWSRLAAKLEWVYQQTLDRCKV